MAGSPESPGADVQACLVGLIGRGRKLLSGQRLEARFDGHVVTHLSEKAREQITDLVVSKRVESTMAAGHDVVHFKGLTTTAKRRHQMEWPAVSERDCVTKCPLVKRKSEVFDWQDRQPRWCSLFLGCTGASLLLWWHGLDDLLSFQFPLVLTFLPHDSLAVCLFVFDGSHVSSEGLAVYAGHQRLRYGKWHSVLLSWQSHWVDQSHASKLDRKSEECSDVFVWCSLASQSWDELLWYRIFKGFQEAFFNWCCHPQRVDPAVDQAMGVCGVRCLRLGCSKLREASNFRCPVWNLVSDEILHELLRSQCAAQISPPFRGDLNGCAFEYVHRTFASVGFHHQKGFDGIRIVAKCRAFFYQSVPPVTEAL